MPLLRITDAQAKQLREIHESGMGYQLVVVDSEVYLVFNATVAVALDELRGKRFSAQYYRQLSGKIDSASISRLHALPSTEGIIKLAFSVLDPKNRIPELQLGLSFNDAVIAPPAGAMSSKAARSYYRYSAYSIDKRIDSKTGAFLPGTYATTYNDIHHVPSGFAAVGRYALPNPASACFVFQLVTKTQPTLVGTAAPNFGQSGGGVEVLFAAGAPHDLGSPFLVDAG